MRKVYLTATLVLALMTFSISVLATPVTDWTVGVGGTVSFDGTSTVTGTALPVTSVEGVGTALNSGVIASITGGVLSFSDSNFAGGVGVLTWGPGAPGTLNITGSFNGGSNITLLSDSFQSLTIAPLGPTSFQVTIGQIQGTIDPTVASYFGASQNFTASSLQLTLNGGSGFPGAFTSTNLGGTINAVDTVPAAEDWNLFTSLGFFALFGLILGLLTRARVLRVVSAA